MKDKLEIGMYVRTKYGIAKIVKLSDTIDDRGFYLDRNIMSCNQENWEDFCTVHDVIGEPSFEIIDVIEQCDLVNDMFVESNNGYTLSTLEEDYETSTLGHIRYVEILNSQIETVVTHEQLAAMSYEVKHD